MVRVSNGLIGILNILTVLLSIPVLGGGIWLSHRARTDCEKFLEQPIIALGVFLLVLSLAGFFGACFRVSVLLWLYLLSMFLLIVLLLCFTVFVFAVTNPGAGEIVSGRGYKEYRLGDYSHWLQKRVENEGNWRKIRSCLQDSGVCKSLEEKNQTFHDFINSNLLPTQSGCCKPPTKCNFTYQSVTVWDKPADFTSSNNSDCNAWQNDPSVLCYGCQSCKAGVLANIKNNWKKFAIVNVVSLMFLLVVYSVGCHARRNNSRAYAYLGWKRVYA